MTSRSPTDRQSNCPVVSRTLSQLASHALQEWIDQSNFRTGGAMTAASFAAWQDHSQPVCLKNAILTCPYNFR